MIAFVYDASGTAIKVVEADSRSAVKRRLREFHLTRTGYSALICSGPKARIGDVYTVRSDRSQWIRGESRPLVTLEKEILKAFGSEE